MRLLITGATGFIGSRIAVAALHASYNVSTLSRREWSRAPLVPLVDRYFGELPFDIPAKAFVGVDAVIHCAASTDTDRRRARAVNVTGTVRLAQSARDAGVGTFVMLSSQSARADAPAAYGLTKFEAEEALAGLEGLNVVILRPGLVCGRGGLFGRLVRTLERLPVVPVVGGNVPVQPIFVGDLVEAVLRIVADPSRWRSAILELGTPEPVPLARFVRLIANRLGTPNKHIAPVPVDVLATVVRFAEQLGVPLPVGTTNLEAMRRVRTMSTAHDMRSLALPLRSPAEIASLALGDRSPQQSSDAGTAGKNRAAETLLVGAGRIGLVHAITLDRLPGTVLAGVADKSASPRKLLRSTGVVAAEYTSLDQALEARSFDAVVVATPPSSHLALARRASEAGLAVLIEKPACTGDDQIAPLRKLAATAAAPPLVGYLMPGMPHLEPWIDRLRTGALGQVMGFTGLSLVSLMLEPSSDRWETHKEISGGGVLANSSGHVLSMIQRAFGAPASVDAQLRRVVSNEVEDAAVVRLGYSGFVGNHYSSWCIPGFPRQENRLIVSTERGTLILTSSVAVMLRSDGTFELNHQLDYDTGFNLAPDYAGGGIASELAHLTSFGRDDVSGQPMLLENALEVEQLLFSIYSGARLVPAFEADLTHADSVPKVPRIGDLLLKNDSPAGPPGSATCVRILDLRDFGTAELRLPKDVRSRWQAVQLFSGSLPSIGGLWHPEDIRVTVPNLLQQTRLISDKRYVRLAKTLGAAGLVHSAWQGGLAAIRQRNAGFWVAVTGLLAGELESLPVNFSGTILLHPYLVDLGLALDQIERLDELLYLVRRSRPRARVGLHSNLASAAANAIALLRNRVDVLSVLASPNSGSIETVREWLDGSPDGRSIRLTAEVGPTPAVVQQIAQDLPGCWTRDAADSILIGAPAEPGIVNQLSATLADCWRSSFGAVAEPKHLL